ncbi:hypothetical protein [Halochromatium sp.]
MPNRDSLSSTTADEAPRKQQAPESALREQPRCRKRTGFFNWLRDAFLTGPVPRRCQRWELLRALRRELDA